MTDQPIDHDLDDDDSNVSELLARYINDDGTLTDAALTGTVIADFDAWVRSYGVDPTTIDRLQDV